MSGPLPRNVLGLPDYLTRDQAESLTKRLRLVWELTVSSEMNGLGNDLGVLRRWFDPVAQGQRLRREVASLPTVPTSWVDPGEPLTMRVADRKYLITPEGRCVMELLRGLDDRAGHVLGPGDFTYYERTLVQVYRDWSRHRLQSVVDLLEGRTKPLQVAAAGVVIALLVNRCTDERRALIRFEEGSRRDIVDRAFFSPVRAFADTVSGSTRAGRSGPQLISGWMLYEAARRLGDALVIADSNEGVDGRVWIRPESTSGVIQLVARDLQRGNRVKVDAERFALAYDSLVLHLREELPALASFGVVHERPIETARLRDEFLSAIKRVEADA